MLINTLDDLSEKIVSHLAWPKKVWRVRQRFELPAGAEKSLRLIFFYFMIYLYLLVFVFTSKYVFLYFYLRQLFEQPAGAVKSLWLKFSLIEQEF